MPQSLSKVYVHITFSTKQRQSLIDSAVENDLYNYIGGICKKLECNPIVVGGHKDHVHILCSLSKKLAQVNLIKEIKQSSSKWIKVKGDKYSNFFLQDGYGIFSVNPTDIDKVKAYIESQKRHHLKFSFKEELVAILNRYKVDYNEEYLWN